MAEAGAIDKAAVVVFCATKVRTFAVVLYISPKFEFSFATYATAYGITRLPHPPYVAPDSDSIKFNVPLVVNNLFGASDTILSAPSIVYVAMGNFAASAIVDSILSASASTNVILSDSSSAASVVFDRILSASASASIILLADFFEYLFFHLRHCIWDNIVAPQCFQSLILNTPSFISISMESFNVSVVFDKILSASASAIVIFFTAFFEFIFPPPPLHM